MGCFRARKGGKRVKAVLLNSSLAGRDVHVQEFALRWLSLASQSSSLGSATQEHALRMIPRIDALVKDHHLPPQMEWMILDLMHISMILAGRSPRACCRPGWRESYNRRRRVAGGRGLRVAEHPCGRNVELVGSINCRRCPSARLCVDPARSLDA